MIHGCSWDTRDDSFKPIHNVQAHDAEVNCVNFSPGNEWILATGSSDETAALWDLRNLNHKLHTLKGHHGEVLQLEWSPHHDAVLATASVDRRVHVWDLARIGDEQSATEAKDGPPELLVKNRRSNVSCCITHLPPFKVCSWWSYQ